MSSFAPAPHRLKKPAFSFPELCSVTPQTLSPHSREQRRPSPTVPRRVLVRRLAETIFPEKSAKAGRFRQHARRVRYPELTCTAYSSATHNTNLCDALDFGISSRMFQRCSQLSRSFSQQFSRLRDTSSQFVNSIKYIAHLLLRRRAPDNREHRFPELAR